MSNSFLKKYILTRINQEFENQIRFCSLYTQLVTSDKELFNVNDKLVFHKIENYH